MYTFKLFGEESDTYIILEISAGNFQERWRRERGHGFGRVSRSRIINIYFNNFSICYSGAIIANQEEIHTTCVTTANRLWEYLCATRMRPANSVRTSTSPLGSGFRTHAVRDKLTSTAYSLVRCYLQKRYSPWRSLRCHPRQCNRRSRRQNQRLILSA
jgi:hypothetical protein